MYLYLGLVKAEISSVLLNQNLFARIQSHNALLAIGSSKKQNGFCSLHLRGKVILTSQ